MFVSSKFRTGGDPHHIFKGRSGDGKIPKRELFRFKSNNQLDRVPPGPNRKMYGSVFNAVTDQAINRLAGMN
jgi:hypothetical protein